VSRILTERTRRRGRTRRVAAAAIGLPSLLLVSGCTKATTDELKRLGLPRPASDRSPFMHDMWIGSWIAAFAVGFFVWGLIIFASIRYRRRSESAVPRQIRYHLPIEMLYTMAPIVVIAVLFFFTVEEQDKIKAPVNNPDHRVLVTAQQWSWTFNYLKEPAAGGTNVYDAGTVARFPQLWLAKGQSVMFTLHSPDVIHDFWVPSFYFKLDIIPGRDQSFFMTPTKLGVFSGHCAELCGYQHSRMLFTVHVVTPQQFDQHMKALKRAGQTGELLGGKNSHTVSGLEAAARGGVK
jgi:cytochrome c oxidase subunit II